MLMGAKSVFCVSRATVLAAVLALGALPAHADGFGAQSGAGWACNVAAVGSSIM